MSAIPARVAGVKDIVVVTPPNRTLAGAEFSVDPIILAACAIAEVDEVYLLGGAQVIGALAYGTESIRPVDKIFGPGNLFVTLTKKQVFGVVGIDGLAGPTETVVIADDSANPAWIASDLLAQAEHDVLASAILLTPCTPFHERKTRGWTRHRSGAHTPRISTHETDVPESERLARRWFTALRQRAFDELDALVHPSVVAVSKIRPGEAIIGREDVVEFARGPLADSLWTRP